MITITLATLITLLCGLTPARAEAIYHYRDDKGHAVFVDNLSLVPARYQAQVQDYAPAQPVNVIADETTADSAERPPAAQPAPQPAGRRHPQHQVFSTAVLIHANQVIVPITIRHKRKELSLNLLLDTGASQTLINKKAIEKLKIRPSRSAKARLADGRHVEIEIVRLDTLNIGPITLTDLAVATLENHHRRQSFDGLLGMDVLQHHPFVIDYSSQRILWKSQ